MHTTETTFSKAPEISAEEFVASWPAHEHFVDLGLIEYQKALDIQMAFLNRVYENNEKGFIIFCRHPAIITLGRASQESDITTWNGPRLEVSRGGKVTYHGPSQLVVYPIVNLKHESSKRPARDVLQFLRLLETCVVNTLKTMGLEANGKTGEHDTGIWIYEKKIASIGIAVRHWVTYHGAAINLEKDPTAFQGIKPCGFEASIMSSIEETVGQPIDRDLFTKMISAELAQLIS